jgi:pyruvate dehydrogenase E1 component
VPYVRRVLEAEPFPVVCASDYVAALAAPLSAYVPDGLHALGTDGFGRSDTRAALRRFFEVDAESVCATALYELALREEIEPSRAGDAIARLGLDPDAPDPARS